MLAGTGAAAPTPTPAPSSAAATGDCDLSGRWLLTLHKTTDSVGNLQYAHTYLYYEIDQKGDSFTVTKGLHCGLDVIGGGAFAVTIDFTGAIPGIREHTSQAGRKGTSTKTASGCQIDFEKLYTVQGASIPYYLDPATPLPSAMEAAAGSTPGWEDWDGDSNPGITGQVSGTVTGKIFVAPREWTSLTGAVPDVASVFKLAMAWDQEPNVMSFDGSPFLSTTAVPAADSKLHFVQLARLDASQSSGDDAAVCSQLVSLAATLTPEAAGL